MSNRVTTPRTGLSPLVEPLRCIECGAPVEIAEIAPWTGYPELVPDAGLAWTSCGVLPVISGRPQMPDRTARAELRASYPATVIDLPQSDDKAVMDSHSCAERLSIAPRVFDFDPDAPAIIRCE